MKLLFHEFSNMVSRVFLFIFWDSQPKGGSPRSRDVGGEWGCCTMFKKTKHKPNLCTNHNYFWKIYLFLKHDSQITLLLSTCGRKILFLVANFFFSLCFCCIYLSFLKPGFIFMVFSVWYKLGFTHYIVYLKIVGLPFTNGIIAALIVHASHV